MAPGPENTERKKERGEREREILIWGEKFLLLLPVSKVEHNLFFFPFVGVKRLAAWGFHRMECKLVDLVGQSKEGNYIKRMGEFERGEGNSSFLLTNATVRKKIFPKEVTS